MAWATHLTHFLLHYLGLTISEYNRTMKLCEYLRNCRKRLGWTQEELVDRLYAFDEAFEGLDAVTLSRWERCVRMPGPRRQEMLVRALGAFLGDVFPCADQIDPATMEAKLSRIGIESLIGKHRRFILPFPAELIEKEGLCFDYLEAFGDREDYLRITYHFIRKITREQMDVSYERFVEWSRHPGSFFMIASYERQFFGVIFSIRLRPDTFERAMHFEIEEAQMAPESLAPPWEEGCEYPVTFVAYNELSANALVLHYYGHLLRNRGFIREVGALPKTPEGERLIRTLGLGYCCEHPHIPGRRSWRGEIGDVLLNPNALELLFEK